MILEQFKQFLNEAINNESEIIIQTLVNNDMICNSVIVDSVNFKSDSMSINANAGDYIQRIEFDSNYSIIYDEVLEEYVIRTKVGAYYFSLV